MIGSLFNIPVIETFFGDYRFLSNFYPAEFVWEGICWPTSEHAYQAAKTHVRVEKLAILQLTASQAKGAGRNVTLRPDWEQVKVDVMLEIVYHKFNQNPELKARLIATGDAVLEEGNTWGDRVWGICPPGSGNGRNELGKILMDLREQWKMEQHA